MQITDKIAMLLISKIKDLGRKMFIYFIYGIISFLLIYFLTEIFGKLFRFILAFITGISFWLSIIGFYLERRNLLNDLENGEMYYIENAKITEDGILYDKTLYKNLENPVSNITSGYILPYSRIFINKSMN